MKTKYYPPQMTIFPIVIKSQLLAGSLDVDPDNTYNGNLGLARRGYFDEDEE